VILVSNTFLPRSPRSRWHNPLSRAAGFLWLILAGWIFVTAAGAAGVGIDATPTLGPWLLASLVMAALVSIAGPWRPILGLSALGGLASAAFALSTLEGSTPDFQAVSLLLAAISLIVSFYSLAVAAIRR
jgi:hypothetical protein